MIEISITVRKTGGCGSGAMVAFQSHMPNMFFIDMAAVSSNFDANGFDKHSEKCIGVASGNVLDLDDGSF